MKKKWYCVEYVENELEVQDWIKSINLETAARVFKINNPLVEIKQIKQVGKAGSG